MTRATDHRWNYITRLEIPQDPLPLPPSFSQTWESPDVPTMFGALFPCNPRRPGTTVIHIVVIRARGSPDLITNNAGMDTYIASGRVPHAAEKREKRGGRPQNDEILNCIDVLGCRGVHGRRDRSAPIFLIENFEYVYRCIPGRYFWMLNNCELKGHSSSEEYDRRWGSSTRQQFPRAESHWHENRKRRANIMRFKLLWDCDIVSFLRIVASTTPPPGKPIRDGNLIRSSEIIDYPAEGCRSFWIR